MPVLVEAAIYEFAVPILFESGILLGATGVTFLAFAITFAAYYAYGTYQARQARNAAKDSFNSALRDRLVMTSTTDNPRSRIYGRARNVDGILFKATHGTNLEFYTFVIGICGHEIDAVESVYFNDQKLSLDVNGYVLTDPFARHQLDFGQDFALPDHVSTTGSMTLPASFVPSSVIALQSIGMGAAAEDHISVQLATTITGNVVHWTGADPDYAVAVNWQFDNVKYKARVRSYLGAPTQDLSSVLIAEGIGDPTEKFSGIACLVVTLEFDVDAFPQGIPNISAVVRGAKVFDPRTGLTQWTQNPALVARDWALYPFGGGAQLADLYDDFSTEANACDVSNLFHDNVYGGTVRPMYTCNLVAPTLGDPSQILAEIVTSMAGKFAWVGGKLRVKAGAYRAPVATITDDWLTENGSIDIAAGIARNDLVNSYRPSIAYDRQNYIVTPTKPVIAQAYIDSDGEVLSRDVDFLAITDTDHAQHVAGVMLRDARQALTIKLPCNMRAYPIEVFDTVAVNIARFGWSGKVFEVLATEFSPTSGVLLTMKETSASIFDPDAGFTTADIAPNTDLPLPWITEEISGLAAVSGTVPLSDGSLVSRTLVSWSPVVTESVRQSGQIEVQYWRATDPLPPGDWQSVRVEGSAESVIITGLIVNGGYLFRARTISSIGVRSRWSPMAFHIVADLPDFNVDWTNLPGRPLFFRVVAQGYSDTSAPVFTGLYNENGVNVGAGAARSYMFARIRRSDGVVTLTRTYDVFGGASAYLIADFVNDLNATGTDSIAVVWTYDEPKQNRMTAGLPAAIYRCGGSPAVFGKPNFGSRSAYVLIGIGGCGQGNGFESYNDGSVPTRSFCDVSFLLRGGNFIVTGANATTGQLSDFGYTGTLDATTDLELLPSGNCVVAGNYATKIGGVLAWDSAVRSRDAAYGAAIATCSPEQTNLTLMFALNSDPALDDSYASLDYAWYFVGDGSIHIFESGVDRGTFGVYATTDVFSVVYDGSAVRYLKNGAVLRTVAAAPAQTLFFDSSFYSPSASLRHIRFGALSANDWNSIGYVNVQTPQIAPFAATEVHTDAFDFGGAAYGLMTGFTAQRSVVYTPPVDSVVEFTANIGVANVHDDSGMNIRWSYQPSGGSLTPLGFSNGESNARTQQACVASFLATGGVALTFYIELRNSVGGAQTIKLYQSNLRVTFVKR